jgi:HPr kinase/phosphorylase
MTETLLHGTAVNINGMAVLLRGMSGMGKSDLAYRLVMLGHGLLADDQVALTLRGGDLYAAAPPAIAGLLEVRGVGLIKLTPSAPAPLKLGIDLVAKSDVPRMPDWDTVDILGIAVPCLKLYAFEVSAAHKIITAIAVLKNPDSLIR